MHSLVSATTGSVGLNGRLALQAAAPPTHPVMQQLAAAAPPERDFWLRLLAADPAARLTVDAALAHPFLQGPC